MEPNETQNCTPIENLCDFFLYNSITPKNIFHAEWKGSKKGSNFAWGNCSAVPTVHFYFLRRFRLDNLVVEVWNCRRNANWRVQFKPPVPFSWTFRRLPSSVKAKFISEFTSLVTSTSTDSQQQQLESICQPRKPQIKTSRVLSFFSSSPDVNTSFKRHLIVK